MELHTLERTKEVLLISDESTVALTRLRAIRDEIKNKTYKDSALPLLEEAQILAARIRELKTAVNDSADRFFVQSGRVSPSEPVYYRKVERRAGRVRRALTRSEEAEQETEQLLRQIQRSYDLKIDRTRAAKEAAAKDC